MAQHTVVQQSGQIAPGAARLNLWAGGLMVAISILHIGFWSVQTWQDWGGWVSGDLWGADPATEEQFRLHFGFWALPGSFAVTMLLLGLLIMRLSRQRIALPWYVGWGFLAWVVVCAALLVPSGFPLGLIPSFLLIAAHWKQP